MGSYLDNFEELYERYVQPNEEAFRENYSKGCLCGRIKYEDCLLDFVPVSDHEYLVMDRGTGQFCGTYTVGAVQSEPKENTVSSILIADEWDIRKVMPVIFSKKWNSIYFVLNRSAEKFASFFKLKDFIAEFPAAVKFFADTEEMRQYFLTDHDAYLPRKIVGAQPEKYEEIFEEIHEIRVKSGVPSQNVLLSICIPTYNRGRFALNAVKTALTSQFDAEIEIVVCDNGSTINTEGYQEIKEIEDSRVQYYEFHQNGGFCCSVVNSLRKAKGKFAFILSDEDLIIPENLETALEWLNSHSDIGACLFSGNGIFIGNGLSSDDGFRPMAFPSEKIFEPGVDALIGACYMCDLSGCCWNMDYIKELNVLQRITENENNAYVAIYPQCSLSLFLSFQFKIIYSNIVLWSVGKESAQSNYRFTNKITDFLLPENRSLQMLGIVGLVKDEVSEPDLLKIVEDRLREYFDNLSILYKVTGFASPFLKMYNWVDVCVMNYKNCLHLFKELEAEGIIQDLPAFIAKLDKATFNWLVCKRQQRLRTPEENLLPALQAQVAKYYRDKGTSFEDIDFGEIEKELDGWVKDFLDRQNHTV